MYKNGIYNVTRSHNNNVRHLWHALQPIITIIIYCAELQLVTSLLLVKHFMYIAMYYENFEIYINIAEILKLCIHVDACVCVHMCVWVYICVYECTYVYMSVYVCMYVCIYTYVCVCACVSYPCSDVNNKTKP